MTASAYHKRKALFKKTHKNPISDDIYKLLLAYEGVATTPNAKLKILVLLYFLCLEYVWGKFGVKGKQPSAKQNQNNLVLVLKDEIEQEVGSVSFQQEYSAKLSRPRHYKAGQLVTGAMQGTQLHGKYGVETISPQKNSVAKYGLGTSIPTFGMSLLTQTLESDYQTNHNMNGHQAEQAAQQQISQMSLIDLFKQLHQMGKDVNLQRGMDFKFFDSAQRQNYLATFAGGVWSCNGKTPFTTGMYPMMYVMDTSHHFFIPDGIRTGGGNFNHSSMLSGKPVICAGTVEISTASKLTYIDNDSGHYKPDTNALRTVVMILNKEFNVNMFGLSVKDKATGVTVPARTFVRG